MTAIPAAALPLGPLDPERGELLRRVVDGLEPAALQWLSGFAAGVAYARAPGAAANEPAACRPPSRRRPPRRRRAPPRVSRWCTARRPATAGASPNGSAGRAEAAGLAVRVYAAARLPAARTSQRSGCSPSSSARTATVTRRTTRAASSSTSRAGARRSSRSCAYAVLALGDSSYPKFCETGRQVDERLAALGAQRLLDRVDCDVDYEPLATPWLERVVGGARDALGAHAGSPPSRGCAACPRRRKHDREHPYAAAVLANDRITGRGATKEVRHLEISLAGSGLTYGRATRSACGTRTRRRSWTRVLAALGLDGGGDRDGRRPVTQPRASGWRGDREITRLTRPFLAQHAERAGSDELAAALAPGGEARLRAAR